MQVVEHAKVRDAQTCVQSFFLLFQSADAVDQLNGLTLLRHVLRNHWEVLQKDQQQQLLQFITAATVDPNVSARAQTSCIQLAYATSDLLYLCGEEATAHFLSSGISQMLRQGSHHPHLCFDHIWSSVVFRRVGRRWGIVFGHVKMELACPLALG
jgi:hypothetical protein